MDFKNLVRVDYGDQFVLTSAQIAEYFGCSVNNIYENFRRCHDRFIEGVHYFKLTGDNLKAFRNYLKEIEVVNLIPLRTPHFYLWTEAGVFQHAKMLNTDKAWEIYGDLVTFYFRYRDVVAQPAQPDDMQNADLKTILLNVHSILLEILDTVNSTADTREILCELNGALKQTAEIQKRNRDIECGKTLAKMVFAVNDKVKRDKIADLAANLLLGEKVF